MNTLLVLPSLIAIFVLILVVKAAAVALSLTGMDTKKASFQALSAITGTGFTTKESEQILNHPLRRRIISILMIMGYAGFITIIVTFSTTIISTEGLSKYLDIILFTAGLVIIYLLATYNGFTDKWEKFVRNRLMNSYHFEETPIENLLRLSEGFGLIRANISMTSEYIGSQLIDFDFSKKGIVILGIERNNNWIPVPKGSEIVQSGDQIVVYGPLLELKNQFKETSVSDIHKTN
tara:strand:+ start:69601 stop:70305 length:705 start_codon:yes stop_codon:yes gene_type:complete